MIAFAKAFMILGALAGICGILGGLGLCLAWINDRWQRRDRSVPSVKSVVRNSGRPSK